MKIDYFFETENATTALEREIWTRRVVCRQNFSTIAVELSLDPAFVRRQWYRLLNRIADELPELRY
jgi:hypothetical protein